MGKPQPERSLLVFADDWGRHPSSSQHLVDQLLPSTRVVWVNTIGTRRPRLDAYTIRRAAEKIPAWLRPTPVAEDTNPQVLSPPLWPGFGSWVARRVNLTSLVRTLRPHLEGRRWAAMTTIPLVVDLIGSDLPIDRWVYYCVDDFSAWPGLNQAPLARTERDLLEGVDAVVAASPEQQARLAVLGRDSTVISHGVDPDRWHHSEAGAEPWLLELEPPLVTFWGVVDQRLDVDWIESLSTTLDRGTILLLGPQDHPDPRVMDAPRVVAPGPVPFTSLPAIAERSAALVLPYAKQAVSEVLQPLKLKEYLATYCPVIAADLPALAEWHDACDVVATGPQFASRVAERVATGLPEHQRTARQRLTAETWAAKASALEGVLFPAPAVSAP